MKEIIPDLLSWLQNGESIAIATVIQTWGSSPRQAGAKMAITASGKMVGSVSGGCVEGAVVEAGIEVLQTREPQLLHFGVADETAWEVGLACGGTIEVFVQPLESALFQHVREAIEGERPAAAVTILRGPVDLLGRSLLWSEGRVSGANFSHELEQEMIKAAQSALAGGQAQRTQLPAEQVEVFADVLLPSPMLVIVGGVHISIALAKMAKVLGYRTVIIDPRRAFGNAERFPHADQLIQAWPDEALNSLVITRSTAIAVLTHDPKLDDPALLAALPGPAYYVGALGSKSTQGKRRQRLLAAGLSELQVGRLHGPIGMDLGARSPEEIALAILAEIVAARKI
jgi:xanthine dehydrogenase accessory factor